MSEPRSVQDPARLAGAEDTEERGAVDELRVTTLELFFDLVFVFTLTQLSSLLQRDFTVVGVIRVVLIFVVLFWMYGGYAWLTNQVPPVVSQRRILLICGMAAFLVCALAIPRAFDSDALLFGIGYLFVVLVHAGLYANAYGRAVARFVPMNILGAACVIAASAFEGPLRYALWVVPLGLQYVASVLTRRLEQGQAAGFELRPGHFVERHGLLLIVAFGESVVAIGIGIGSTPLVPGTVGAAVLALVLAATLWWTYFGDDERQGEASLINAPVDRRVVMALNGYFYAYIPILLGVIALAAGVKVTLAGVGAQLGAGPAILLGGGVGLYLCGDVLFRLALRIRPIAYRVGAAVAALATLVLGMAVSGLTQLLALVIVLLAMIGLESRRSTD